MLLDLFNPWPDATNALDAARATDVRRRMFWGMLVAVSIPALIAFGIRDIANGKLREGLFDIAIGTIFFLNIHALRKVKNSTPLYRINALTGFILHYYYVYTGGGDGSAVFWVFSWPPAATYLLGRRETLVWVSILFAMILAVFLIPNMPGAYTYTAMTELRFCIAFSLVVIMSYGFDSLHQYYNQRLQKTNAHLQESLNRVQTLESLLPICARCKKIRDDAGTWKDVETYISKRLDTKFTHGICPECQAEMYPGMHGKTNDE